MLMVEVAVLAVCILASFATGIFVYARNPKQIVNRIYALLTISLILFSVANFFSLETTDRLFYIRSVIFFTTIAVACLYYLVIHVGQKKKLNTPKKLGIYFTAVVAVLDFTPFVFSGLQGDANPVPVPALGALSYVVHLMVFMGATCILLAHRMAHSRGVFRLQYMYMLIGMLPMFLFAPLTGVVMPLLFDNTSLVIISPVYGAFFVGLVGYAIVKHRLFDIKLIIARSLAYASTILALSVIYGFLFFGLAQYVFKISVPVEAGIFFSIAISIAALAFHRLKVVFDRISNKLFYQDAYSAQELFDTFNQVLVSIIDINKLLHVSTEVINQYIKSQFCIVVLPDHTKAGHRVIETPAGVVPETVIERIYKLSTHIGDKVIVTDDLEGDNVTLRKVLHDNNIAVLVQLAAHSSHDKADLGYMILGAKKSGNVYTSQDITVTETLANELIIAIQNALRFEEIEAFNETLQQKVEEATRQLRHSNEKLKQLDETKDDFISMASHQLRTPLTSIKGYVSMVLDGDAGKVTPLQQKLLGQAFISSQRMVYLISDLLNVSRLRTGKFILEPTVCNLADMIQEEVRQLIETARGRNLELIYSKPDHFPNLMFDETKMRQVIMNFIDNAIYYTPAGGSITVELNNNAKDVEFKVVDTGIGVPKSEQHHLFSKFYRANNAKRARPDGTGLGLFMAHKVVLAQGGATIFRSQEGKGSTFGFTFAKKPLIPPANAPVIPIGKPLIHK